MATPSTSRQAGFGHVALILALIIVFGAMVGIGYVVVKKQHDTKSATPSDITPAPKTLTTPPATSNEPEEKYLTITDLGIKIRLTDDTKDLVANVINSTNTGLSLQSFIDATTNMDVVWGADGKSNCLNLASVELFMPEQRGQLENNPIQAYTFDTAGRPTDSRGQGIVQLADKRYAVFRGPQATCLKGGENVETLRNRENAIRTLLGETLPNTLSSL